MTVEGRRESKMSRKQKEKKGEERFMINSEEILGDKKDNIFPINKYSLLNDKKRGVSPQHDAEVDN